MDNPRITVESSELPYDTVALKRHIRALDPDQDAWLADIGPTAVRLTEEYLARSFITKTYEWKLDSFTSGRDIDWYFTYVPSGAPRLPTLVAPVLPLLTVASIAYLDATGATVVLAADQYEVDAIFGRIRPSRSAGFWPQTGDYMNAVTVTFTAGYGTTHAAVPSRIKTALHSLIGYWFENREAMATFSLDVVPLGFFDLIEDFRRQGF